MTWYDEDVDALDLETTSNDPETARIVEAALVRVSPSGTAQDSRHWLVDPGVAIPAEASRIHGITGETLRQDGAVPAAAAVGQIAAALAPSAAQGTPLVVFNAPFDLTVLDRELRRHTPGGLTLHGPILDPLLVDRRFCTRTESRVLAACCTHHAAEPPATAHRAHADAASAAALMFSYAERYPAQLANLQQLQWLQGEWHAIWANERRSVLARRGEKARAAALRPEWPVRPTPAPTACCATPA